MASQRQIEANRRNRARRGPLTPRGRERLRQAALRNKPWRHSTGPRTPEGKAASRENAVDTGDRAKVIEPHAALNTLLRIGVCKGLEALAVVKVRLDQLHDGIRQALDIEPPPTPAGLLELADKLAGSDSDLDRRNGAHIRRVLMSCEECLQDAKVEESVDAWDRVEAWIFGGNGPLRRGSKTRTNELSTIGGREGRFGPRGHLTASQRTPGGVYCPDVA